MSASDWNLSCPSDLPTAENRITLAHGEGGRLTRRLIQDLILPALGASAAVDGNDAAVIPSIRGGLAFTCDSFVVSPLFFPGGDIGTLAVYGAVNDLAVSGAQPRWLSLSFILEEGLPLRVLERVIDSVAIAAKRSGIQIVTGDTKVVPRGAADGLFITTSGIGELVEPIPPGARALQPGDELLVSGPVGAHGIAILACREKLGFEPAPRSDCAPLTEAIAALREAGVPMRALRDATRGGVAAVLHEWAEQSGCSLSIDERMIPVSSEVRGACELLGLDPLHVANEGTMVIAVEQGAGDRALEVLRGVPVSEDAAKIGKVQQQGISAVSVMRGLGIEQPLDELRGSPLPRIC